MYNRSFKSKLLTYFTKKLGIFPYRNGWYRVPVCPFCSRENKYGINLSTNRTNCFRCGTHLSAIDLAMELEGFTSYSQLIQLLNNGNYTDLSYTEKKIPLPKSIPQLLPEGFKNISDGDSQLARTMRNYIKKRGFSIEEASKFGIGYGTRDKYFGYLIIPYTYHGQLRYFNARRVLGVGPRYNNPDKETTGLGKEFIIFNQDALEMYNSVYICEGAINALTLGNRAIALMGKSISQYQLNLLIKSQVKRFILLLDPDAWKKYAIPLALKLVNYKRVKVIQLPEGKDVNDLGKSATLKLVYNSRYLDYKQLINLKNAVL